MPSYSFSAAAANLETKARIENSKASYPQTNLEMMGTLPEM